MGGPLPDGLTALHAAVLRNDRRQVRALLKSREYGVDVRSSTGVTPLMVASLYGRERIFFYLVKKRADIRKHDYQDLAAMDYAKGPNTRQLVQKYRDIATSEPRRRGRHTIYYFLKAFEHASKSSQPQQPLSAQPSEIHPPSTIFLRSQDSKQVELMELQRLATTVVDIDLGRKSTGTIRSQNEAGTFYTFAISGWAGVKGENVLCNREYSGLVRRVCSMYGFKLEGSWLDNRWRGDPAEKSGSYLSSHAEKQLGIWVLVESLSQALGTKEITNENVMALKERAHQLPARLRETLVELDHEPCSSCINFLNLLREKSGLIVECEPRKWFVEGQRSRLRRRDGHAVSRNSKNDYEISDELDKDGDDNESYSSSATMEDVDDAGVAIASTDPLLEGNEDAAADSSPPTPVTAAEGTHRLEQPRQLRRHTSEPYHKGRSPITEPPHNRLPRWPEFDVTPRPPTSVLENLRARFAYNPANNVLRETSSEYEVERILDSNEDDGLYKVKWTDSSVTWEPTENLINAQEAIDKFKQATESSEVDAPPMEDVDLLPEGL
ncbi:hypothetical protein VMCG_10476 [Cytospora schulzeri]|uniref:Chromo domain-containing protein n=1 Tax=Cytospora schulzeri TaxID=448051 RepID=A0A423VBJ0_9PEZI|nr:hypothetical protein VMCG_10476 [Valsa malicola]